MANIKSAIKKIRVDARRKKLNDSTKLNYKTAIKSAVKATGSKDAATALSKAYKEIDKAAKKHVIPAGRAARLKSRIARYANA